MDSKSGGNKPKAREEKQRMFQSPRGMHDVLPSEQAWWDRVSRVTRELAEFYGFGKIDTPILESAALFERGVGEETDMVQKEMFVLKTRGGDLLALRPENTAGVARAYLEHHLGRSTQPQKLYYQGPFFRHENPQAGRFREFHQIGFEIIGGVNDPVYDAEIILIFARLLTELKIKNTTLKMNSIGCRVCRPLYRRQLQQSYRGAEKNICADCVRRLKTNPLRLLDCKKSECQEHKAKAPAMLDKLCITCSNHFKGVLEFLDDLGIAYGLDNHLVRGLDYYNRTVFEFSVEGAGAEVGVLPGGGRYDYLMELLGGRLTPAVGGACGIERVVAVMKAQEIKLPAKSPKKVFLVHVGDMAKQKSLTLLERLRAAGISAGEALGRESLRGQLKIADKEGYELALIFGQRELFEQSIIVRNLKTSAQETVHLEKLVEEIKKRLK